MRGAGFERNIRFKIVGSGGPLPQQDIEFGAPFVKALPKYTRLTAQYHEHPTKMSGTARFALSALDALRETGGKLIESAAYGSIGVVGGLREVVDHRVVLTV